MSRDSSRREQPEAIDMNSKVTHVPARDSYRIDHTSFMGEYCEWFYNQAFKCREDAQAYIDCRNPKDRKKLKIVKFHEPAHNEYHLGTIRL